MSGRFFVASFVVLLALLVAGHTFVHYALFVPQQSELAQGVSGFIIGKLNIGEEITSSAVYAQLSQVLLYVEWAALALILIILMAASLRHHARMNREYARLLELRQKLKERSLTPLDEVTEAVKEMKEIKFTTIAKAYKVKKDIVRKWAEVLESANLVRVVYPRFGEPALARV